MTTSELIGAELFEDSSRAQTAGNFNNSCESCHFEGGADGNVWQRPDGPRSTMPVWGGSFLTGLILWKGVRINMGETGPMFAGENGGLGVFDGRDCVTYERQADGTCLVRVVRDGDEIERRTLATAPADNYVLWAQGGASDVWIATARGLSHGVAGSP